MWIFKNDAFVSIVQDKDWADQMWVRARVAGDLERFFGDEPVEVIETPDADYRFRAAASRGEVADLLFEAAYGIDYVNFKNSIGDSKLEEERHNTYLKVWASMMGFQRWALNTIKPKPVRKKGKKKGSALAG